MKINSSPRVLFITAPALGHVTRLLAIAEQMQVLSPAEIIFATTDSSKYTELIALHGFQTRLLPTDIAAGRGIDIAGFGKHLETLIADVKPAALVVDCNLLSWCSTMRWPNVPRILITNVFLTSLGSEQTYQELVFPGVKDIINKRRQELNLPALNNATELYDADVVCLADPAPVIDYFGDLPDHFRACGMCNWQPGQGLGDQIPNVDRAILFSLGSTGPKKIPAEFIRALRDKTGIDKVIYAASNADSILASGLADYAAGMYPLMELLPEIGLAVTQGGAGSTYQALSFGVPTIVAPGFTNHKILGAILQDLGGVRLMDMEAPLESLKGLDIGVLTEEARRFAAMVDHENGPLAISKEILEQIENGGPLGGS